MTSPASELLVQESLCTDLFKTISESVEATRHVEVEASSVSGQDDIVGKLLDKMIQILPPEERNIFGTTEDKNIEEIIEEANELIRATTPLFSSTDSGERSWNKTSKALSKTSKASESCNKKNDLEEVVTPNKSKSGTSSICSSMESIIVKDSLSHDLSDRGRSFQMQGSGSSEKLDKDIMGIFSRQDKPNNNSFEKQPERDREMASTRDQDNEFSKRAIDESNKKIRNIGGTKPIDQELPKTNTNVINTESKSEITTQAELENSNDMSLHTLSNSHKDPEAQLEALRQKYTYEIQELKLAHNKEIYGLTKQITCLNDKIFELQKHSQLEKSPDLKIQEIERLENEIKCQEQLLAGYERENKKLCKEISNLKEGWKQRESKLVEEKQRLQNELQGMVSKTTTDTLQEQLKDARETIVKLQIEVTSYKSKNRELEMTCDRLRVETQSLQRELSNCRNPGGRRDKYALLASGNVGSQILELKNVIARKDMEIAQMSTTLRILKGELSNREVPMSPSPGGNLEEQSQQLELTVSQLQTSLAVERQNYRDLAKEKDNLLKENLDLKRQVRELESIVKRRQRSDSCFPVAIPNPHTSSRLAQLEKELSSRQESLTTLHSQFISMQKKYEDHIQELENRLKESRDEIQAMKVNMKKEEANQKMSARKTKLAQPVVKEETHLLATIRGLRQEVATKEKDINKLNKEVEEMRQTNRKLQKEREKQLNTMPAKMGLLREKPNLKKVEKSNTITGTRNSIISPNNNIDPIMFAELQESNMIMKSKNKSLQEEVKRLEQDLIAMHNKRVHDLNMLQSEHELETARLVDERAALIAQSSSSELEGQLYTQQMVINHLKNRLKQMEELKNEVTMLRAERDHLEQRLSVVNKEMCYLQNASAHSPESIQYKTLLEKLETLEKNQEIREQKLNAVRELLSRSTQGQGQCSGTCRDKLLDKNRQICFYRAQMDRILESLVEIRRTK